MGEDLDSAYWEVVVVLTESDGSIVQLVHFLHGINEVRGHVTPYISCCRSMRAAESD